MIIDAKLLKFLQLSLKYDIENSDHEVLDKSTLKWNYLLQHDESGYIEDIEILYFQIETFNILEIIADYLPVYIEKMLFVTDVLEKEKWIEQFMIALSSDTIINELLWGIESVNFSTNTEVTFQKSEDSDEEFVQSISLYWSPKQFNYDKFNRTIKISKINLSHWS